jgi:hypothetical protein
MGEEEQEEVDVTGYLGLSWGVLGVGKEGRVVFVGQEVRVVAPQRLHHLLLRWWKLHTTHNVKVRAMSIMRRISIE